MSLTAAASGFVVVLLSVQVIQGQDGWGVTYTSTHICAVKGSTVEITCSYTYPSRWKNSTTTVKRKLWFTKWKYYYEPVDLKTDSEYSDRVQYSDNKKDCTLRISDLRESDSAVYKFMFTTNQEGGRYTGSPGVTLSVTGLQVISRSTRLECQSSCRLPNNPSYVWYKNGQEIQSETLYYLDKLNNKDSYSCALQGYKDFPSPSVYGPKRPSVSVSPSAEIVEGSSVTLTCSSDANPAANYTWYKENQTLPHGQQGIYHFTSISSEDRGNYYCKSENQLGQINSISLFIDVQYGPNLPSVSVSPSAEIVEGSSVNLTCSSDANPAANYTWYKENEDSPKASGQIFTITDFRAEHSGDYYCEAQNRRGRQNSTLHLTVVAGSMKSVATGSITAIFLAIIFLCAFLFIRRKRSSKRITEQRERPDNQAQENMGSVYDSPSAPVQRTPAEQQDDLCYASVSFSKNQEEALYSNIRLAQPHRHKDKEEDEDVEYTAVNLKRASATTESRNQEAAEDLSALYNTVSKHPRV